MVLSLAWPSVVSIAAELTHPIFTGSFESLQEDPKLQVFCSNPKFDLTLNSADPEDFLEDDDDDIKPLYPDIHLLFSG